MVYRIVNGSGERRPDPERIVYMRQMLGELRAVAEQEQADMLCYLIEMAYIEAGELLLAGSVPPLQPIGKRYGPV